MKSQTTLQRLMKQASGYLLCSALMLVTTQTKLAAQDKYEVNANSKTTSITVSGTSNIHDWNMTSPTLTCNAQMLYDNTGDSRLNVSQLEFSVAVKTLKSGKGKMDDKTYTALKADKYNTISFKLVSATALPYKKDAFNIQSTGTLTVAGVTKQIEMTVACQVKPDGTVICVGSKKLKMTDYNVKPPTALFGTITSGNDITISFILDLKKSVTNYKSASLIN
jgi:polyisoprenoid-binding protein YceI